MTQANTLPLLGRGPFQSLPVSELAPSFGIVGNERAALHSLHNARSTKTEIP